MAEVIDKSIYKLSARYQSLVENKLADDDRSDEFPPELGTVYRCQELRCSHLPSHGHRRRAYCIWMRL